MPKKQGTKIQRETNKKAEEQRELNRKKRAEERAEEQKNEEPSVSNSNEDSDSDDTPDRDATEENGSDNVDAVDEHSNTAEANVSENDDMAGKADTDDNSDIDSDDDGLYEKPKRKRAVAKSKSKKNSDGDKKKHGKKNKKRVSGKTDEAKQREKEQAAERREERKERWRNRKRVKEMWREYKEELDEKHADPEWKVWSARVFDKFIPERADMPYTHEQDIMHARFIRTFLFLIVLVVGFCGYRIYSFHEYKTSSELLIPATTYSPNQKATVKKEIEKQGFTDITQNKKGTYAHGTPKMVQAYKDSYKKKLVDPAMDKLNAVKNGNTVSDLISIYVSKDYKSISINTSISSVVSTDINKILTSSQDIERAIDTIASWNIMNGNDTVHLSFWHITVDNYNANDDDDDNDENANASSDSNSSDDDAAENANVDTKEFYSCDVKSCSQAISDLEAKEYKEAKKESKSKSKNSNKSTNKKSNKSSNKNSNSSKEK